MAASLARIPETIGLTRDSGRNATNNSSRPGNHNKSILASKRSTFVAFTKDDLPVIRAVWPEGDPEATEQRMRDLLARFGLMGDQVYQPVAELSGGERSRAALVKLVARGFNVLVLDEPTNHLDLWARDALE